MNDNELLSIFWIEVGEYLGALNAALLEIETAKLGSSNLQPTLREMNRVAHSMKGAARAVGIGVVESIAHYMEEVFGAAMGGELRLSPEVCDLLYDGLDLIQTVADGEEADEESVVAVVSGLEQMVARAATEELPRTRGRDGRITDTLEIDDFRDASTEVEAVHLDEDEEDVPSNATLSFPALQLSEDGAAPQPAVAFKPPSKDVKEVLFKEDTGELRTMVLRPAEDTIRVTVSKLDRLMAEASELLITRLHGEERGREINELRKLHNKWGREWRGIRAVYIRLARRMRDADASLRDELTHLFKFLEINQRYLSDANRHLAALAQALASDNLRLGALADQLQDDIGGMRLVPFETIVGGFQRMMRDLARDTGKGITLDIDGAGVEIDKAVLDALKDPIMHLLRNAADHGLELPSERERLGKPPSGHIRVAVEQRGSEISVLVRDDGRGIDTTQVRTAAVRRGLMNEAQALGLSEDEARSLIFHPGLSTSAQVTAISGRGVGMDVVRSRVESLRGRVAINSVVGEGTSVTLSVPVSLTRIRCILVRVGMDSFALPSVVISRMETIRRDDVFTAEGREMIRINDHPMPLASLATTLGLPTTNAAQSDAELPILILQGADRAVAFAVDALLSEQELVLKPLGRELERARYVAGAALMGSGDVILVLDANELVRGATGRLTLPRLVIPDPLATNEVFTPPGRVRVLVVDDSITTRTLEKNILETAGYDVRVAIDGVEGWRMVNDEVFDVVICDVEMPNMDGLELTRRIKGNPMTTRLPVILLTSLAKPEQREAGLTAGADAYLVKSRFDQAALLQAIQAVI